MDKSTLGKKLVSYTNTTILGGIPDVRQGTKSNLSFFENGIEYTVWFTKKYFSIDEISNIHVEGKDEISRRITATRLLLVGVFALAFKKKTNEKKAYVTIELLNGEQGIFEIDKKSPMEVTGAISSIALKIKAKSKQENVPTNSLSAADEIAKWAKLKDKGVITQEEFDTKKSELLM